MKILYFLLSYCLISGLTKPLLWRLRGMSNSERNGLIAWQLDDTDARILFWGLPWAIDASILQIAQTGFSIDLLPIIPCSMLFGWLSAEIPHSNWQSPGWYNYFIMSLLMILTMAIMASPLIIFNWHLIFALPFGLIIAPLCWLSYSMKRSLNFWGINWCKPGDSSWEELFIGLGFLVMMIGMGVIAGVA